MDPRIHRILKRVAAEKDETKREQMQEEYAAELTAHFLNPRHSADLVEIAYDFGQIAWSDKTNPQIMREIVDVKTVGYNDTDYIDEFKAGLHAYWQGPRGEIESGIMRSERFTVPRAEIVAALDWHLDDIKGNIWGALSDLQSHLKDQVAAAPVKLLIQMIRLGIVSGSTYGTFSASSVTSAQVDPIISEVKANSTGGVKIIGTAQALDAFSNIGTGWSFDAIQEQLFRFGRISGNYKTAGLVELENFIGFDGQRVLPDNEVYIVGRNAGRLTYYGGPDTQLLDFKSFRKRQETKQPAGLILHGLGLHRLGRIVLT